MEYSIFVVTRPEDGWDCVQGVYKADSEDRVKEQLMDVCGMTDEQVENKFIVHEVYFGVIDLTQ